MYKRQVTDIGIGMRCGTACRHFIDRISTRRNCLCPNCFKRKVVGNLGCDHTADIVLQRQLGSCLLYTSMDQSDYINMTVDNAMSNIWMGVLFAAIVLLVFLRDFGATLAISIAMPCCILFTFLLMFALDITLNIMSLGGIALGVGMIVDKMCIRDRLQTARCNSTGKGESIDEGNCTVDSGAMRRFTRHG